MSWMLSVWVATALLALCKGQDTVHEGNSLSASGYHLCVHNVTRNVSFLVMHPVPYIVTKPCGGWILWKTCTVTLYRMTHQTDHKTVMEQVTGCCSGYEQVGRYCARPVNRSDEFTAKPGSCPTADGLCPRTEECEWDMDCPGWQKCCHRSGRFLCIDPASSANYSENGGYRFNATVTVKTDYEQLISSERGLLNHTRLLQAMVTGALKSDVSVYYLSSQPVHPYRTATSLLIECNLALSLHNATSKLHHLLKHIQEVTSVSVEDVDECDQPALQQCSPHADCNNTVGSYHCSCHQGFINLDPRNPGAHCTADVGATTTTELPLTSLTPRNTAYTPAFNSTQEDPLSTSSTVEPPLPTTTCSPPSITSVWSANVTGTSFRIYWSSQFQTNQTYQFVLRNRSEVVQDFMTNQTMVEVRDMKPGMLYNVTVTPSSCGRQGVALGISAKTDAQTLDATARLTNIQFTSDLHNTSSQAYENLTESIRKEIYQSLSPEMKAMVDSGQVRIEIKSFSPGSVVVNFTIVFAPSQNQDIGNVSTALLHSLMNSTKYTVDGNNTSTNDFDECASGENDCSQWATCTNTWASYTCVCLDGFTDNNPERPGRACQEITTTTTAPTTNITANAFTPTAPTTSMTAPTTNITAPEINPTALITNITTNASTPTAPTTNFIASTTNITTNASTPTAPTTNFTAPTTNITTNASTPTAPATNFTAPTTNITTNAFTPTAPATNFTAPTTNITTNASTPTAPATNFTAPTTNITTNASTPTAPATNFTAPTTNITTNASTPTAPTTNFTAPTTNITTNAFTPTAPATNMTAPTTNNSAPEITPTAPTTNMIAATTNNTSPEITPTAPTTNNTAPTTNNTATVITPTTPTTNITAPANTTTTPITSTAQTTTTITTATATAMISMTSNPTTPVASITPTITAPTTTTAPNDTMLGAISVQCRVGAITVTIAKDFLLRNKIREHTLYLGLPECAINGGNASHAQLTVAWNECGTSLVHNETYYTASVTLFNNMDMSDSGEEEVPRIRLEAPIMCTYMKSILISADFGSMGYDMIKDFITGSGTFQVTVQLMNGTIPLPSNHSLSSGDAVVVEVSLSINTSLEQIKVIINKCWATPTQNPEDASSLTFLENSCSLNPYTTVLMNGNSTTSRVSVQIFSIVNLDVIYLHCLVQICVEIGSDTCVPDCLQRTARSSKTIGTTVASSGALLRSSDESLDDDYSTVYIVGLSCLGVGVTLILIIGFVCIFYFQRNRIGHYNFSVKPKQENFTYLVFNT
ncbi:uromodulin-like 1 [Anoplopoma fimbria]|uniref:uromodulin-like 1 n=1 Tax=Anoplopoma fimbria TaxID=229290 RepID=UPI0023ED0AE4|nr:uromodulin-like 1 [Anoplopoma fimbria]